MKRIITSLGMAAAILAVTATPALAWHVEQFTGSCLGVNVKVVGDQTEAFESVTVTFEAQGESVEVVLGQGVVGTFEASVPVPDLDLSEGYDAYLTWSPDGPGTPLHLHVGGSCEAPEEPKPSPTPPNDGPCVPSFPPDGRCRPDTPAGPDKPEKPEAPKPPVEKSAPPTVSVPSTPTGGGAPLPFTGPDPFVTTLAVIFGLTLIGVGALIWKGDK